MGRALGKLGKWVLGPAIAAALGYYVVGPRYAGKVSIPKSVQEGVAKLAPRIASSDDAPSEEKGAPAENPAAPQVSVGVKPVEERREAPAEERRPRTRRRRRRATPPPSEEAAPEPASSVDRDAPDPASTP